MVVLASSGPTDPYIKTIHSQVIWNSIYETPSITFIHTIHIFNIHVHTKTYAYTETNVYSIVCYDYTYFTSILYHIYWYFLLFSRAPSNNCVCVCAFLCVGAWVVAIIVSIERIHSLDILMWWFIIIIYRYR